MSQNLLIIGGCGYIGSSLYLHLKKRKHTVTTVDLEWFGNYSNPDNIKKDYDTLSKTFLRTFDTIILLAGHSSVSMCAKARYASFENNVAKFLRLLDKIDTQKLIYASSSGVYGKAGHRLATENSDRYTPTTYYDIQKKELDYYAQISGLQTIGLRFGTVNGHSLNLRSDLMINKMYLTAKSTGEIHVSNPHLYRPILGIPDLCRALTLLIETPRIAGLYNLASFNLQIGTIARRTAALTKSKVVLDPASPSYNFSISSKRFCTDYGFKFLDTPSSIVTSLTHPYNNAAPR